MYSNRNSGCNAEASGEGRRLISDDSWGQHPISAHGIEVWYNGYMETLELSCDYCGVKYLKRAASHRYDLKKGKTVFFCTPAHYYEYLKAPEITGTCFYCQADFARKKGSSKDLGKYCSRKCAATAVSKETSWKRRGPQNRCLGCGGECARRKRCQDCKRKENPLSNTSLGELKGQYDTGQYHAKIRGNSRSVFNKSQKKRECLVCGYSLHVDICHIRPVHDFSDTSLVGEVNDIDNLIALCKLHHWEFDNGHLDVVHLQNDAGWSSSERSLVSYARGRN